MSFRLGALLCLSGLAACSHNSEAAKDPTYVQQPTVTSSAPATAPVALDNAPPPPDSPEPQAGTPLVADTKGAGSNDFRTNGPTPPAAEPAKPGSAPDNTEVNERDKSAAALTPMDQDNNQGDLKITQQIRQAVMADDSLSFTAKNVKIITQNGKVTLRGPVNSAKERSAIDSAARKVAGHVDNQLEVTK